MRLYKNKLLYLGRDYPKGTVYFRERLKTAFMKNRDVTDSVKVRKFVDRWEFVIKELEVHFWASSFLGKIER
uniref:Uncharacterized protein n=1 Tax=Electrophorus electricus TaxID=8005 RepID=A0AAY5EA78_ELEEL